MRPEITEPIRKIRKSLTLIEVDMDDTIEPAPSAVEQQLQKIENQIQVLRELNKTHA
jgi:hypothetical protein